MASLVQPTPIDSTPNTNPNQNVKADEEQAQQNAVSVTDIMGQNVVNPLMPQQAVYKTQTQTVQPNEQIAEGTGQITTPTVGDTATADTAKIADTTKTAANVVTADQATAATMDAAQGTVSDTIQAQTGVASQGTAATGQVEGLIGPMAGRTVNIGEIAGAAKADKSFLGDYDAATTDYKSDMQAATMEVTEDMTVQGQLENIGKQFGG